MTPFDVELAKTEKDIETLRLICQRDTWDSEKRVRLAYRQFHRASLTGNEFDFKSVRQTIAGVLRDFGPKEDICLLKSNVDGHFHCLDEVKQDLQMCPMLAHRYEGRSIIADLDFQEGRYAQARVALETLISESRKWDALARLAHWKGKMGFPVEADSLYEEAENELTAKELRAFAWLELQRGALAISRGQYDKASLHYQRAATGFPGHWLTDEHMASLAAAKGDFDDAAALLRVVVVRTSKPEAKQALGELLMSMGKVEEARAWLDTAAAAFLRSVQEGAVHYYHHLVDFYADTQGQPAEAIKWARKDVALRTNFSTQAALAWALFKSGEIEEGLDWIRAALSSGVQDGGIFATAACLFRAAGDATEADRYSHAAAEITPGRHACQMHQ